MKKLISGILAGTLFFSFNPGIYADSVKEIIIDTDVPVFRDLDDGASYSGSKDIYMADLSKVDYIIMKEGRAITEFNGNIFDGYSEVESAKNVECVNYTNIATISETGSYMIYAEDEFDHGIAVRFKITKKSDGTGGGGGGGGGTSAVPSAVKPPYVNNDPSNTGGKLPLSKVYLSTDTGNAKIYYTVDGTTPTEKSALYAEDEGIQLNWGDVLKAVAIKNGVSSKVSVWECMTGEDSKKLVSRLLECDEHIVYMSGYPDGGFAPDKSMTRAEVVAMFARLMKEKMDDSASYKTDFTDVDTEAWYANYLGYMQKFNIINGYGDGSFKPDATVTRAEFVTIAARFATMVEKFNCTFKDISPEHWAYDSIAFAAANGWIGGYEDNTFRPEKTITRAEVVTIVNNMLVREADAEYIAENAASLKLFDDTDEKHWAYEDIIEATNPHEYSLKGGIEIWK